MLVDIIKMMLTCVEFWLIHILVVVAVIVVISTMRIMCEQKCEFKVGLSFIY